ncbi:hypothetical protein P280DRAFT_47831 [Massarina eburnea CBS 473.64]|uniref:Zn(2)-C6 fungal-type domain-containing protein n=1 Tax=Massarina eburnea CBS 473.64 TaxID=1395130 RepID=A0A6A6RZZ5_9PLEO|nr:hypothetical protein P280DRAFT_47831 [Massarina eburnea CBS 473.64]
MSASHEFSKFSAPYPYSPATSHFSQSSMADPNQQARQPSYPSPHNSYPSPQMPTYTYPPPQGQSAAEPYRSPQGASMSLNLPPIRLDGPQQPSQQQPGHAPMGSPLPPPQHGMPQYYPAHAPPGPAMNMGQQHMSTMRYQLPPQQGEQRILSGGRHKKEIKRRTKTGCLTCRKRRIKCDEAHPVCRNCQKSKRDCLGYDPIFKQQPGPTQIQPAPNSTPHQAPVPAPAPTTSSSYAAQVPQGYAPAAAAGYAPPPPQPAPGHPQQHDSFNTSAIDPALAATDASMHAQQQFNGVHALSAGLQPSPYPAAANGPMKVKQLNITDLFQIANHSPPDVPSRSSPIPPDMDQEFTNIYTNDYCTGLDVMLETRWYTANNNALNRVFADRNLHEEAIFFTETIKYKTSSSDMSGIFGQEARLLWHLLETCRHPNRSTAAVNGTTPANAESDHLFLKEVRARLDILEALLTFQNLGVNPVRQLSYPGEIPDMKRSELEFWEQLGEFVVHAEKDTATAESALGRLRNVLHALEIRDAIYSVAIARHVGNRVHGFPNALPQPVDSNPDNDINKLSVAMSFISHECRSGSQQVIARICDMALLSWTASRAS